MPPSKRKAHTKNLPHVRAARAPACGSGTAAAAAASDGGTAEMDLEDVLALADDAQRQLEADAAEMNAEIMDAEGEGATSCVLARGARLPPRPMAVVAARWRLARSRPLACSRSPPSFSWIRPAARPARTDPALRPLFVGAGPSNAPPLDPAVVSSAEGAHPARMARHRAAARVRSWYACGLVLITSSISNCSVTNPSFCLSARLACYDTHLLVIRTCTCNVTVTVTVGGAFRPPPAANCLWSCGALGACRPSVHVGSQ